MKRLAPAKINLGLRILRRRDDGYHDIETGFLAVPWTDEISVSAAEEARFTCSDDRLPTDADNLCVKAVNAFVEHVGDVGAPFAIHLQKNIPFGAGLGGGSSDAAAMLLLLADWMRRRAASNVKVESRLDPHRLELVAGTLGSDVPFFVREGLSAKRDGDGIVWLGRGRGERLNPITTPTQESLRFPFDIVVVAPEVFVSTAAAYSGASPNAKNEDTVAAILREADLTRWRDELTNDFEPFVFSAFPQVARIKYRLYDAGAGFASLSGSGSAVYGLFEDAGLAAAAASQIKAEVSGVRVWVGDCTRGHEVTGN